MDFDEIEAFNNSDGTYRVSLTLMQKDEKGNDIPATLVIPRARLEFSMCGMEMELTLRG